MAMARWRSPRMLGADRRGPQMVLSLLAVLALVTPGVAQASSEWQPMLNPGVRLSSDLNGPTLASGQLQDRFGTPSSGWVAAVAWPTSDALRRLEDGDFVHTQTIAQAVVGNDGVFTLRVDDQVPLNEYRDRNGTINIDVLADGAGGRAIQSMSRRLPQGAGAWVDPARPSGAARPLTLSIGGAGSPPTDGPVTTAPLENKIWPCPDYAVATYNQLDTAIGETYPGPSATAQFKYQNGSTSTLGVGFSVSGELGSYSPSGTAQNSDAVTITWGVKPANSKWFYRTTFQYKKFQLWIMQNGFCQFWGYEVRQTAFQGGVQSYTVGAAPTANNCSPINGGMPVTITKNQGTAVTWSNGVNIHLLIGIDLSSRTGFNAETWYTFKYSVVGRLCGTNTTYPTAGQVVGKGP